jgi:hypothetical protein
MVPAWQVVPPSQMATNTLNAPSTRRTMAITVEWDVFPNYAREDVSFVVDLWHSKSASASTGQMVSANGHPLRQMQCAGTPRSAS